MPKITEEQAQARKLQIIQAAMICFAEKGFHKTSMKDICAQADLSPGAVYSYFDGKESLINALAQWGRDMNSARFDAARASDNPQQAWDAMINLFFDDFKDPMYKAAARMDLMLQAESLSNEKLASLIKVNYEAILAELTRVVTESQQAGVIDKELDPKSTAQILVSLHMGMATQLSLLADLDVDAYKAVMRKMVFGGLWSE